MKSNIYEVAILGAGASGLMAASILNNEKVCVIEGNESIGKKIKVSGGGKCNITNKYISSDNYLGDKNFLDNLFEKFDNKKLLAFLNNNGVFPKIDEKIIKGTYFCKSSNEVIEMFTNLTKRCKFFLNHKIKQVIKKDDVFFIQTDMQIISAKKVIVALGSSAYPVLGASNMALEIANGFGIKTKAFLPALVGISVQRSEFWFKNLSGISADVRIKILNKEFDAKILFTHKGISGPAILNTSLYWQKGGVIIDFLPKYNLKDFKKKNGFVSTVFPLPKRFMLGFLNEIGIEDKPLKNFNEEEFSKLNLLKNYSFSPAGTLGFNKAEVCKGGIEISEIDENFQSKKVTNLYFLGECVDITGELGGYNFQYTFASGYICASSIDL